MSENSNRLEWLDAIKGIGIILVTYSHFMVIDDFKRYILSFNLPLFFVVYGYCAYRKNNLEALKKTFFKRFYSLMVPYLLWALIFGPHTPNSIINILYGTNQSLTSAKSSGVLWFFPVYFLCVIITESVLYLSKDNKLVIFITGLAFLLIAWVLFETGVRNIPWGADVALFGSSLMLASHVSKDWIIENKKLHGKIGILLCIVGYLSGLLCVKLQTEHGYTQMAKADYGNIFFFYISSIGVNLAIFATVKYWYTIKKSKLQNVLRLLGANSIMIMILHRDFVVYYPSVLRITGISKSNLIAVGVAAVAITISYFVGLPIRKYVPALAGKRS
jgi:fucose 4-O-acetylase-like acetyltransferase